MKNLDFLFEDNKILQGNRISYNLNIMNVTAMFAEGCHILIYPAVNRTSYSNIKIFPDISQDGIQIRMCEVIQAGWLIFTSTWSIQMFWVCLSWNC